jgi:hypothetical protein
MNSLQTRIADFFKTKLSDSSAGHPPVIPVPMYQVRAEVFQFVLPENIRLRTGELYSGFSARVYGIHYQTFEGTLALYHDDDILWLDDHSSNTDYETFMRREGLLEWLPDKKDRFVDLLIETKFTCLPGLRGIRNVHDIPLMAEEGRRDLIKCGGQKYVEASDEQLARIGQQISPSALAITGDFTYTLDFYIWTKMLGRVINLRCFVGPDSSFKYEGAILANGVGDFIVP